MTASVRADEDQAATPRPGRDPADLDFESIKSEEQDSESSLPSYEIATYPADFTLEVLYQKWKNREIKIPDFQRNFVWKQIQSSRLIESFLMGLPVPVVFFYSEKITQKYLVIDGQQRLKSVFYYFDGLFGPEETNENRKVFKLRGLDQRSSFFGKTFEELQSPDKIRLKNSVLRAFIVQQLNPNDDTSMYHIFERLNAGGTLLANQEIRNCIYYGKFVNFLEKINTYSKWREILGKEIPDSRRRDIELLLRYFALMEERSSYKKPMKDFLSKFMQKYRNPSEEVLRDFQSKFEMTCSSVVAKLGMKPFHIRVGLNAAVFDAVMIAFAENLDRIPQDILNRYKKLIADKYFEQNTLTRTTDVEKVIQRISQASAQLFS